MKKIVDGFFKNNSRHINLAIIIEKLNQNEK